MPQMFPMSVLFLACFVVMLFLTCLIRIFWSFTLGFPSTSASCKKAAASHFSSSW